MAQSKKDYYEEIGVLQTLVEWKAIKKAKASSFVEKIRQKKRPVTDDNRRLMVCFFKELGKKTDYGAIARILDKNLSTIWKLLERLVGGIHLKVEGEKKT